MKTFLVKVVVGVLLSWIMSIWERFQEAQRNKEEGRKEVADKLAEQKEESDKELEKLRDTDTSFDTAIDELRKRSGNS